LHKSETPIFEKYGIERQIKTSFGKTVSMSRGAYLVIEHTEALHVIEYLDYLLYALQIMSDDLATLRYRTFGKQKAPLIIRTRGNRLEGIWHSG